MEAVDVLYGASVLPIFNAPDSGDASPMKLLRDVRPPLTTSLVLLLEAPVPEAAETSICVSSW